MCEFGDLGWAPDVSYRTDLIDLQSFRPISFFFAPKHWDVTDVCDVGDLGRATEITDITDISDIPSFWLHFVLFAPKHSDVTDVCDVGDLGRLYRHHLHHRPQ